MRTAIYSLIQENVARLNAIKHIDLYNNQLAYLDGEQPFETPALLVEFSTINWNEHLHGIKEAAVEVKLHIITDSRAYPYNETLNALSLVDDIVSALYGSSLVMASGAVIDCLTHTQSITDHDFDELQDNVEVFVTHVTTCRL